MEILDAWPEPKRELTDPTPYLTGKIYKLNKADVGYVSLEHFKAKFRDAAKERDLHPRTLTWKEGGEVYAIVQARTTEQVFADDEGDPQWFGSE